ncbi:neuronal-specific septin-3 isoform X4 [Psammomys obesus]|uniref:neuronal-specific septin-3 isoform X4 n=1 Tax=Psammomys obesus TaxID=48139 RepID=UPI002452CFDE|nr:neuronal-specific septin-3 isoform X4 [Psammomys obesus]
MDHDFVPAPPEKQPHRAPGPGPRTPFSRSHMLGRHTHQKPPGDVSPLIPVIKKSVHLDAFPQSNVPQKSNQPSTRSRAWSMSQHGTSTGPLSSLPPNSCMPRKLSSVSLMIRQNVQTGSREASVPHWEEMSNVGKEAASQREGKLCSLRSPLVNQVSEVGTSSGGHENPDLTKPNRTPPGEKPLVSSCLALPFPARVTQSSSSLPGAGPVGQIYTRISPGRGKPRPRGIPRSRANLQRATPATGLSSVGRNLGTAAIHRPELAFSMSPPSPPRLGRGTELPILDAKMHAVMDIPTASKSRKATDSVIAGRPRLGTATNLTRAGTTKPGQVMSLVTSDSDNLENVMLTATEGSSPALSLSDEVNLGITRLDRVTDLAGGNVGKLDTTTHSPASDPSRLGRAVDSAVLLCPDTATGETNLDAVSNLTIPGTATYLLMPSRSTDLAQDYATVDGVTDSAMEPVWLDLAGEHRVIEEGGVKMKLTVIDTPGFGDQINNENCWEPIEKYINEQYEKFLKEEVNIARKKRIPDTRVHCCLYFISPTGHSLRPLDLEFMKHLSKVVNIIPVIAKADTMTLEEKSEFKQRVRKELEVNGIEFYPQKEFDEDLEDKTENDKIRQESMPFAVVGSDKEYQVNGKRVLGRKTPWGIIEVENLNHCEFALLRDFVIRTHLQDLKEVTHNIHYETYRAKRLNDNGGLPPGEGLLGTALPPVLATPCPTAE